MAFVVYNNLCFPHSVGGPGPLDVVALTVTATGGASANPVKAQTDIVAFNAAVALDQTRHIRFSNLVTQFSRYGMPVAASVNTGTDTIITLSYERKGMFENSVLGKPGWFNYGHRANAFDLCAEHVASNPDLVSVLTVTINGAAQSGT